ncbi:MAG TPA: diaminopimelate dehydrogenase [Firmicutes bacterium]|nr:diaminopimelate dehydrogenase [Bacillota bacterium]
MKEPIRIGIVGYGNLGRGVEQAVRQNPDLELAAVFTRRPPDQIHSQAQVLPVEKSWDFRDKIDVMVLCGSSANDLPEQGPLFASQFNTVDSYDLHARIPEYFERIDAAAKEGGNLSLIAAGWDPGLFSLARVLFNSILPKGKTYTFWGKGVSQGHSVAVRRLPGVKQAVQYTVPVPETIERIRKGETPELTAREQHQRICYVVPESGADRAAIETAIKTMPGYFADYDTTVYFITEEEFAASHTGMPHGGFVITTGTTGGGYRQQAELRLELANNPEFTGSVLAACARAVYRLRREGKTGACTMFDLPVGYLSPQSPEELRAKML